MWRLLQIELFKISKRPRTYIAFAAITAIWTGAPAQAHYAPIEQEKISLTDTILRDRDITMVALQSGTAPVDSDCSPRYATTVAWPSTCTGCARSSASSSLWTTST